MPVQIAFLIALAWVAVSALACLPLFTPPDRRPAWVDSGAAAATGLCVLGTAWVLGRRVDFPGFTVGFSAAAILVPASITVWRRAGRVLPAAPRADAHALLLTLALALWISPVAIGSVLMSRGEFPAMFFNIDTAFRLVHTRELLRPGGFPPRSLSNVGVSSPNHYAAPASGAALSAMSGLPPHTALLGVALPVAALGAFAMGLLIVMRLWPERSLLVPAFLLLVLTAWHWPISELFEAVGHALRRRDPFPVTEFLVRAWRDRETFGNGFEDVTHLFGRTLFLVACVPLIAPTWRTIVAGAIAVVLLGQVKPGHALIGAIVLAVACGLEALRRRDVRPIAPALAAPAAGMVLARFGQVAGLFRLVIEPFWMLRNFPGAPVRDAFSFVLIVVAPLAPAAIALRDGATRRRLWSGIGAPLLAVAAIYAFFNLVGAWSPGRSWSPTTPPIPGPFPEFLQPLLQIPSFFAIVATASVAAVWPSLRRMARGAVLVIIALLTAPPLVHRAIGAGLMITAPERAHEYADNRDIAAALRAIPLDNSVVATNDHRYPTENYSRDSRQFQIPAVWGHQAFGLPGYDRYPGWGRRVLLQRALWARDVPCDTLRDLRDAGVTHLLFHKRVLHPSRLPLKVIYDDRRYTVYELRASALRCDAS